MIRIGNINKESDAELIAYLRNHAKEIINLVEAAENVANTLNGGMCVCETCGSQTDTTDFDFAPDLYAALEALNKEPS